MSEEYKGQKILFSAHSVHLKHGLDLLGSKMSLVARIGNKILVLEHGVVAISGGTGRHVYIPNGNVKGVDITDGPITTKASKMAAAQKAQAEVKVIGQQAKLETKINPKNIAVQAKQSPEKLK